MGFLVFLWCGVKEIKDFKEINVKVFNFFNRFKFFRGRDSSVTSFPQNDGLGSSKNKQRPFEQQLTFNKRHTYII